VLAARAQQRQERRSCSPPDLLSVDLIQKRRGMTTAEMTSFVIQPFANEPFANEPFANELDSITPFLEPY
jgi:hypothetical protein